MAVYELPVKCPLGLHEEIDYLFDGFKAITFHIFNDLVFGCGF